MPNEDKLGEELLKENGLSNDQAAIEHDRQIKQMLAKAEKRLRGRKRETTILWWISVLVWPVLVLGFSAVVSAWGREPSSGGVVSGVAVLPLVVIGWCILIPWTIISAILGYVASRNLSIAQTQASLAEIALQLKRLSDKAQQDKT